ncbi:glycosyltransferase family 8 protein [bacterium]|nr:glycosyltransferase family 8 protein [bacterium]
MKKILIVLFIIFIIPVKCFAKDINIAFCIDNNYPIFALIAMYSILENNTSNSTYNFYIVENNLSEKNKYKIEDFIKTKGQNVSFIHINTDSIDNGENLYGRVNYRITRIAMARIKLPEILPENIHRIIYLDADIIVTDDLLPLFEIDLEGKALGMVEDSENLFPGYIEEYYNTGVLVMDIDIWRKENLPDQILTYFRDNRDFPFIVPDQDLVNIVLKDKIKPLSSKWNNQTKPFFNKNPDELKCIHHYFCEDKPWNFPKTNFITYKLYYEYWDKSPFKNYKYYYYLKYFNKIYNRNIGNIKADIANTINNLK